MKKYGKRMLAWLVSLCMILSLLPVSAFADDFSEAAIGEVNYSTLQEAIEHAEDGDTITLLQDVTTGQSVKIEKELTVDFGGHTLRIEGNEAENGLILCGSGADVTLTNGKIEKKECIETWIGGSYDASIGITVKEGASLIVGMDMEVIGGYGIFVRDEGSSVDVYGEVSARGGFAVSGNGTKGLGGTTITIRDTAVITSIGDDGVGIYHPQEGELIIEGGTITGAGAVEVKSGTVRITGDPILTATSKTVEKPGSNNGNSSAGYALAVIKNKNYVNSNDVKVEIEGGTFNGVVKLMSDDTPDDVSNETTTGEKNITITGGTFENVVSEYCAEGYKQVDGKVVNENGTVAQEQPSKKAEIDGAALAAGLALGGAVAVAVSWKYLPVHKIEGAVQDAVWNGLPGATVILLQEDKVIRTVTTNEGGGYTMYVPRGVYTLEASYVIPETGETVSAQMLVEAPTKNNSGDIVLKW